MGAGRKTQTTTYDSANRQGLRGPAPQYKKLDRDELGGVIFGATKDTINECLTKNIFGLPYNHIGYVQHIVPGMPLFLFNYSDRKLHGIFEATSEGELHIDPHAWSRDGKSETSYPAQVRVKYREQCQPLHEVTFSPAIEDNYYSNSHFMFELTHEQAATLCSLFTARNPSRPNTAPVPQQTVSTSHAAAWAGASAGQGDNAWANPPPVNAWGSAPPPPRPDTASKPPLPAWQSGAAGPSSNGGASTSSGLPADGGAAAEAERRRQQSERDREVARKREEEARAAAERQARAEAKMRATAAEEEERQKMEAAAAERRKAQERAERERQVLEKLKNVSVNGPPKPSANGPSANGAAEASGSKGADWEREANARAEAEQKQLTEERMRLFDGSRPLEEAVKVTVQKNLELCAAAISHMRQEALKSKKLAEEMTSGNAQMQELTEVRAENERLARSQTVMQRRMDDLEAQITTLRQSVVDLLSGSHVAAAGGPAPAPARARTQEVYLMGGFNGAEWLGSVDRYRPSRDEWESVAPMSAKRSYAASAVLDGMVYVFGGGEGQLWYDTVERYDRSGNSWTTLSSMKIKRGSLGGAAVQGKIYAVGGGNGVNNFAEVEVYDPGADKWITAPPMLDKRFCVAATEMNNSLYALGGFDGQQYLVTMERYDPREGYWVRAPSMSTKRGSLSASVYNNSLYALGGFDGNTFLNTVESYEPRMNKWKLVPPMHTQRAYGASMVVDNALYFVGGLDGALHVDSVERYTPDAGWQIVKTRSNSSRRSFLAVAVL